MPVTVLAGNCSSQLIRAEALRGHKERFGRRRFHPPVTAEGSGNSFALRRWFDASASSASAKRPVVGLIGGDRVDVERRFAWRLQRLRRSTRARHDSARGQGQRPTSRSDWLSILTRTMSPLALCQWGRFDRRAVRRSPSAMSPKPISPNTKPASAAHSSSLRRGVASRPDDRRASTPALSFPSPHVGSPACAGKG